MDLNNIVNGFIILTETLQLNFSVQSIMMIVGLIIIVLVILTVIIMSKENYLGKKRPKNASSAWKERKSLINDKIKQSEEQISSIAKKYQQEDEQRVGNEQKHLRLNTQLRELTSKLQDIQEEERTRIAREIHDELGQQLTAIKMDLSQINKKYSPGNLELKDKLESLINLVEQSVHTIRKIATQLRPGILDDLGLIAALEWQCVEFEKRYKINCTFNSPLSDVNFNKDFSTMVFRITQETLNNIVKHSGANKVDVLFNVKNNMLFLEIKDNGAGITQDEINNVSSLGILGMRERVNIFGGELLINGTRQTGTTVNFKIPLPSKGKNVLSQY